MGTPSFWSAVAAEARDAFAGEGRFPLPAYSELMPPPYVGIKPYDVARDPVADGGATAPMTTRSTIADASFEVTEYEQHRELEPGIAKASGHILAELDRLIRGKPHELSSSLLLDNPAWPSALREASPAPSASGDAPLVIALSGALSRTQDEKGNVRWTFFGASHDGPGPAFWRSFGPRDADSFARFVTWATGSAASPVDRVRVLAEPREVPAFAQPFLLHAGEPLDRVDTIVTFRPFATLPADVQRRYLAGTTRIVPHPASQVFFEHTGYRKLAEALPHATQIALLHLFARSESGYGLRIPQSGWLDEQKSAAALGQGRPRSAGHHKLVHRVVRTHRWQRTSRDESVVERATFDDAVSVALFSVDPDALGLYGKPMARNAQVWNEDYGLVLDGPRATHVELERAAATVDRGGRFGYRFFYPPMRLGRRDVYWHRPLVARLLPGTGAVEMFPGPPLLGYMDAEAPAEHGDKARLSLTPRMLARPGHVEAATLFERDPGRQRFTTANNIRKLLEFGAYLGGGLTRSLARSLMHAAKHESLAACLNALPALAAEPVAAGRVAAQLTAALGDDEPTSPDLTFAETRTRAFEEHLWKSIAGLAEGSFRTKETADVVLVNKGKTGGPAAHAAGLKRSAERDLDRLGDHLHDRYRALAEAHGMTGIAQVVDHAFQWQTEFSCRWSDNWNKNQLREAHERNIVFMIPGRNRREAVIMADHYDTAYMEDVYDDDRGGDGLRAAAAGADDNHSATAALLAAAEVLLARAREGRLARDVWLVHLTGEEFPSDCLGARALAQALVERRLRFAAEDGSIVDVSDVRVVGAFVLDMIAHNSDRDRDIFQIAPGEGAAAAALARRAHLANESWNRQVEAWNRAPERSGKGRAERSDDGARVPPPFAHLPLQGEIRPEWDPRSALYNTDGQIFSDVGIPVVLFMENYDINRTGYHDTHDTMKNIDLDYAAALTAIAIESVAQAASS